MVNLTKQIYTFIALFVNPDVKNMFSEASCWILFLLYLISNKDGREESSSKRIKSIAAILGKIWEKKLTSLEEKCSFLISCSCR